MTNEMMDVEATHSNDILCQRFDVALTLFDERRIDFIKIERSRFSFSSNKNSKEEELHANNIMTKKKRQKKLKIFKDKKSIRNKRTIYEKTKLEKKKQENENVFYVEIDLRLIFAQFTTHFAFIQQNLQHFSFMKDDRF
jgi:hypothetical protein